MLTNSLFTEIQVISKRHGLKLTHKKNLNLCKFLRQLSNWNNVHNLTGHSNIKTFIEKHVLDAWSALQPLKKKLIGV